LRVCSLPDVDRRPFFIIRRDLRLSAEQHDAVPLGAFLLLAVLAFHCSDVAMLRLVTASPPVV
jgi:hypothetical protein